MEREKLASIKSYDEFSDLSLELGRECSQSLFNFLFPIAISNRGDGANSIAGLLLIELEPRHTRSCEALLDEIAKSKWDVSNKEIPFYLISQFGKWNLMQEYEKYIAKVDLNKEQKQRISTIPYWASGPTASLAYCLHAWNFEDLMDGNNYEA